MLINPATHFKAVPRFGHAIGDVTAVYDAIGEHEQVSGVKFRRPQSAQPVLAPDVRLPSETWFSHDDRKIGADDDGKTWRVFAASHERQPHREAELIAFAAADEAEIFVLMKLDGLHYSRVGETAGKDAPQKHIARAFKALSPAERIRKHGPKVASIRNCFKIGATQLRCRDMPLKKAGLFSFTGGLYLRVPESIGISGTPAKVRDDMTIHGGANNKRPMLHKRFAYVGEVIVGSEDWSHSNKEGARD